ncbi:MAG: hypothetical protein KDA84_21600, partial [Planctomycetaceae bacterium]|nr:hypothetical protein [Planctomycetaceae bacterium]
MIRPPLTLTRRFLDNYFLFGLAKLFAFLIASLLLAWQGLLTNLVALALIVPLFILFGGGFWVRAQLKTFAALEKQLILIAETPQHEPILPKSLLDSGPVVLGSSRVSA